MKAWNTVDDDGFNYCDFFNNIMGLFRDEDGQDLKDNQWVKETVSWWNQ